MKSIRLLDRRAGYSLSALGLLLGMVAPAVLPTFASAELLTSRSITMSTAKPGDTATYDIKFTAPGNISGSGSTDGGVIIGFCSNSPLTGAACTTPTDLDLSGATLDDVKYGVSDPASDGTLSVVDFSAASAGDGLKWVANDDFTGGNTLEFVVSGIVNPSTSGTFYARITTYANDTDLGSFATDDDPGDIQDDGSIALSTSDEFGVTAYVMESMTFCVSKGDIGNSGDPDANSTTPAPSENCGSGETCPSSGCVVSPTMTLGQVSGAGTALDTTHISTGGVYAQLSTNASSGATVALKSDATDCGGLYRGTSDAEHCGIAPNATGSWSAGSALFGLTVGTEAAALTAGGGAGSGTGSVDPVGAYNGTDYNMTFASGNGSGVTGPYGSPIFASTEPINNMNVPVTFGASVSNLTPAGVYGAHFNMIATGTF